MSEYIVLQKLIKEIIPSISNGKPFETIVLDFHQFIEKLPDHQELTDGLIREFFSYFVRDNLYNQELIKYTYKFVALLDDAIASEQSNNRKLLLLLVRHGLNLIDPSLIDDVYASKFIKFSHDYPNNPLILLYASLFFYHQSQYKKALEYADSYIKEYWNREKGDPVYDLKIKLDLKYASYLVGKDPEKAKEHLDDVEPFWSKTGQYEYINQIESQQRRVSEYIKIQERFDQKVEELNKELQKERGNQIQMISVFVSIVGFSSLAGAALASKIFENKNIYDTSMFLVVLAGCFIVLPIVLKILFGSETENKKQFRILFALSLLMIFLPLIIHQN